MSKIKSVSEAFSMQPVQQFTRTQKEYDEAVKANENFPSLNNYHEQYCKEIFLESLQIGNNIEQSYYVGYNFNGKKIFQYVANAVNIVFE